MLSGARSRQSRRPSLIAGIYFRPLTEKYLHDLKVALARGEHQSRVAEDIARINIYARASVCKHLARIAL